MKEKKFSYGFICFLSSLAFTIFILLQYVLIETINQTPYNMSENYVCVSIEDRYGVDKLKEQNIRKKLIELINSNKNIVIVKIDENMSELSIFDSNQTLCSDILDKGEYFMPNDFCSESTDVLIEKDSATYFLMENNNIFHNEKNVNVKGVYYPTSILASPIGQYEIVTTLINASTLEGTYYFDHITQQSLNQILRSFKTNGYEYQYINDGMNKMSYLEAFLSQSEYIPMLLSVIFIYLSLAVTFKLIFKRYKRAFIIHWTCGASRGKLFKYIMSKVFVILLFSTLLGNIISCLLLRHVMQISLLIVLTSFLIQCVSIMCLLVASYLAQKIEKE